MEGKTEKKLRILCLHGFRTSGGFLKKQISKWDPSIFAEFDLVFPDGIFPAGGKSDIEGIFPPPYFEWFQFDKGATLSALLLGYQAQGKVLKEHPPMKLFVSVSGSKFRDPSICEVAYKDIIKVKSVHFIGAKDWLKLPSEELATSFDNPLIIRHPQGHTVPRLDEVATEQLRSWTAEIIQCHSLPENKMHQLENGQAKVVTNEKNAEEANKINNQGRCAMNTDKREVEGVEPAQA